VGSREAVLAALRAARAPEVALPEGRPEPVDPPELHVRLAAAVAAVGGELVRLPSMAELAAQVAALAARLGVTSVVSDVASAPGTMAASPDADPHTLDGVGLAVLAGEFAVAENGAVWVPGARLRPRALFVIAEHLALVVRADAVVSDLHEAYERIRFDGPGFGVFIAGPSKTADIEQALVIGAHGARSCTVFLVD
jgi:L-lactate dehydrogenase complex protein LldG